MIFICFFDKTYLGQFENFDVDQFSDYYEYGSDGAAKGEDANDFNFGDFNFGDYEGSADEETTTSTSTTTTTLRVRNQFFYF